jgi:hypothetical protein
LEELAYALAVSVIKETAAVLLVLLIIRWPGLTIVNPGAAVEGSKWWNYG